MINNYEPYLHLAIKAAKQAGEILISHWDKVYAIHEKEGVSNLVTAVDRKSEQKILKLLQKKYPDHGIIAEESGHIKIDHNEFTWVIDPLDGTTNYTHHFPMVSISIGLLHQGIPVLGVIYNPILKELYYALKGGGAFLNDVAIKVSKVQHVSHSLLATGFAYDRDTNPDNNYDKFFYLTQISQGVRRIGSAALDLAFVAAGRLDGYWERGLQCWDVAAGMVIVEEAGGKVSSYDSHPTNIFSRQILATNGHIHSLLSQAILQVDFIHKKC